MGDGDEHVGTIVADKYRLTRRIGSGASAHVYRAREGAKPGMLAVKLFKADYLARNKGVDRFFREARIIAKLDHPSAVRLHDFGMHNDCAFMVMDHVRGYDLKVVLAVEKRFRPRRAAIIGAAIFDALAAAHRLDIIHRDLKPGNVRLLPRIGMADEQIKILDFGLAKLATPQGASDRTIPKQLTAPGLLVGTPRYLSPEQVLDKPLDGRSDLYSAAVIVYEMLAGRVPLQAKSIVNTAVSIAKDPAPQLSSIIEDIDPELEEIVMRCLEKKPDDRYPDVSVVRDKLRMVSTRL